MGTRGIYGFILDGKVIASYNHFDSYPDYLGVRVLEFAREVARDDRGIVDQVAALRAVDQDGKPDAIELAALRDLGVVPQEVSTGDDWYAALRDTQGDLRAMLNVGVYADQDGFFDDALFCEWGYLVDLDERVLRVYCGGREEVGVEPFDELPAPSDFVAHYDAQH